MIILWLWISGRSSTFVQNTLCRTMWTPVSIRTLHFVRSSSILRMVLIILPTSRSVFSIYLNRRYHESTGIGNGHATMNKLRSKRAQNNPGPWMLNTLHPNQVMLCAAMERGIPVYNALGEASRPLLDRHLDCLSSSRKKGGVVRLTR